MFLQTDSSKSTNVAQFSLYEWAYTRCHYSLLIKHSLLFRFELGMTLNKCSRSQSLYMNLCSLFMGDQLDGFLSHWYPVFFQIDWLINWLIDRSIGSINRWMYRLINRLAGWLWSITVIMIIVEYRYFTRRWSEAFEVWWGLLWPCYRNFSVECTTCGQISKNRSVLQSYENWFGPLGSSSSMTLR